MLSAGLGDDGLELFELADPTAGPGEVLVEMRACGVCGTDLEKARGDTITNRNIGHEVAGRISQVGEGVVGWSVGERVSAHHHVSCGSCSYCRGGRSTLCELFGSTHIDPGGFSECFTVPRENVDKGGLIRLGSSTSFTEGALLEPAGCCIRALSHVDLDDVASALVVGAGPAGLVHLQLLKLHGADSVLVSDLSESRLEFAERFGATDTYNPSKDAVREEVERLTGDGVDLSVVATASLQGFYDGLSCVRPGGVLLQFGVPPRGSEVTVDLSRMFLEEITLKSSYSTSRREMEKAKRMVEADELDLKGLVTHRYDLSSVDEAFDAASDPDRSVKVMVEN